MRVFAIIAAVVLAVAATAPALAASPSQTECEASGGTFSKQNGKVSCVVEENVGNSDNSQTKTDTTGGQGNIGNKTTESCGGPGGSGDNSAHCQ